MFESSHLTRLVQKLRDPKFLEKLLYDFGAPSGFTDENVNIQWEALPYYLPTENPRITYRIQSADGNYLLKLNTKINQIKREGVACHLLYAQKLFPLAIPYVIDMELCVELSESTSCGWLLAKWVNGHSVLTLEHDQFVRLFTQALLNLHAVPVTNDTVRQLFAVPMPGKEKALSILHERRMDSFDKAIKVCGEKLLPSISHLKRQVASYSFSPHIALNHGDLHVYNMKLESTDIQNTFRLFLFDWEDITLDHPLSDLANFMLSEKYSERALESLKTYVYLYNQKQSGNDIIFAREAWMLTSVCFVKNLCWRLQTTSVKHHQAIEHEAMETIAIIQERILQEDKSA